MSTDCDHERTLSSRFASFDDEHLKFDRIESPLSSRADLCAFMMLDRLVGGDSDIVSGAEHDVIYLSVKTECLELVITDEQIRDLVRCGVMYSDEDDYLFMFA